MPLLIYCVTRPDTAVPVGAGVFEAEVVSRELSGLRVYWSAMDDPAERLGDAEKLKQAALEFHRVLREILKVCSPIPFRFPTLVESEEALEQHLGDEGEVYRGALERVGDAVQYEMIGSWPDAEQGDTATPVSGKEYLKRRQEAMARIDALDSKLKRVAGSTVREWRQRQDRRTHRWFALVPREAREQFIAALKSAGPSEGLRLRLTGPWPPSEFITPQVNHGHA